MILLIKYFREKWKKKEDGIAYQLLAIKFSVK